MENQGAMKIPTKSKEGIVTERIFYDAPVERPILSVAGIAREGATYGIKDNAPIARWLYGEQQESTTPTLREAQGRVLHDVAH